MAITVKTTSYDGIRTQIRANLKTCGITNMSTLEIVTSNYGGIITAWVVDSPAKSSYKAIMKGPPCSTSDEALQGLLEAASELVSKKLAGVFETFEQQLSVPVGEAFVLDEAIPQESSEMK